MESDTAQGKLYVHRVRCVKHCQDFVKEAFEFWLETSYAILYHFVPHVRKLSRTNRTKVLLQFHFEVDSQGAK